jgi:protein-S-isoprenylcysteine O-methyltransferase Ste14
VVVATTAAVVVSAIHACRETCSAFGAVVVVTLTIVTLAVASSSGAVASATAACGDLCSSFAVVVVVVVAALGYTASIDFDARKHTVSGCNQSRSSAERSVNVH